jgi:hypothetical protein
METEITNEVNSVNSWTKREGQNTQAMLAEIHNCVEEP